MRIRILTLLAFGALAAACLNWHSLLPMDSVAARVGPAESYPQPGKTPGVVATTDLGQLCPHVAFDRPSLKPAQKRAVLVSYGIDPADIHDYVVERFIPPSLGGSLTDPGNLWPMRKDAQFDHNQKVALVVHLHNQVCAGNMSLTDAHAAVKGDWVAQRLAMKSQRRSRA